MSEPPGVSIIIPNYNYARFVGAAIDSALAQDHPKTEVIVVDDGSTDDSRAVIASFGDRIRTVYQANAGHVAACNAGWLLARHEIVIFLDSDDLLMPDAASSVAAAWRPGVSKMQWTLQVVDQDGRPAGSTYPKYPSSLQPTAVRKALLDTAGYPCPPTSGNAYARAFLEALSPIEGHQWMDPILTSVAPLYGEVITVNRALAAYRCHGANDSEQSTITARRFERYVENEESRIAWLETCCRRMNIAFDPIAAKARSVGYQEAQLMAAKLRQESRIWPAGWNTITAVLRSPQSPWHRWMRALWAAMVVLLPLAAARKLIEMRYMPVRRPRSIEVVARVFERGGRTGSASARLASVMRPSLSHPLAGTTHSARRARQTGDCRSKDESRALDPPQKRPCEARVDTHLAHGAGGRGPGGARNECEGFLKMREPAGVSIIIPNYNLARFLGAAIESALAQDHPETEVIVVDDGSTDNSREVIEAFGDRIRTVYQRNQGHIKACETGWALGHHDIVIFLDSDDLLAPSVASTVAQAWRPGISKMQWCVGVIDGEGRSLESIFPKYPASLEPQAVRSALLRLGNYPCPPQSANAYSRWFLESCFTGDSCTPWMGGVVNPVAPLYGDVVTLHRPLTLYRIHGTNGWAYQRVSADHLRNHIAVFESWCAYVQRCCERMGVEFDADSALKRNLWYQQDRLVLAKMLARDNSEGREPLAPVLRAMLGAIRHGIDPAWQRAALAAWAVLVATLPPAWSQPLISLRCEPSQRPKWLRLLAEHVGQRRRSRAFVHAAG